MTIDSNVVIDAFERGNTEAQRLIGLHPHAVRLQVASRTARREALRHAPELVRLEIGVERNLFRLGLATIGGPDGLASETDKALAREIQETIFPSGVLKQTGEVRLSRVVDVDIAHAHLKSGADYLVTRDDDILNARDRLVDRFGVRVLTPGEALNLLAAG